MVNPGNIRSVKVDYWDVTEKSRKREELKSATGLQIQTTAKEEDSKRSSSSSSNENKNSPQFAPLDVAILESVNELCDYQYSSGVHVSTLIEHLDTKYANRIDLPAVKYIDCAINGLLRSGKLNLYSLAHEQMESSLLSASERARQSVFVDQLLFINEQNITKQGAQPTSRSTTLDSGIRSWDLGVSNSNTTRAQITSSHSTPTTRPSNQAKLSKAGAFSLWRSLSFKGKTQIPQFDRWQQSSIEGEYSDFDKKQSNNQEKSTKLTGLFRSKSVRCVGNSQTMRHFKQHDQLSAEQTTNQSATIDYLASATCKRGSSMLTRNNERIRSGRIVLFLRKLFIARRTENKILRETRNYNDNLKDNSNYEKNEKKRQIASNEIYKPNNAPQDQPTHTVTANQSLSGSPFSSSADSSGSNSLIEILDCSPVLNSSRRPLIEETIETIGTPNRATRRLVKRSDSNLSQNSQASISTTKSNVSQQLRRHLDEAYKRHRHCTSQRERDFIDSINVLRQASRHAIQQSVKSRQINQRTRTKSSISELETQSSNSSSNCASSCEKNNNNNNKIKIPQNQYHEVPTQELDLNIQEPNDSDHTNCRKLCNTSTANGNATNSTNAIAGSLSNCCLCNSYLTNATKLCPLLSSCPTSGFGVCCLGQTQEERQHHHHQQQQQHLLQMHLPEVDRLNSQLPEFCCPLWHSMLYGYCPPLWSNQALPSLAGYHPTLEPTTEKLITSQNLIQQQHQQQQLHQHQHNTTIDLKIEIGADFLQGKEETRTGRELTVEPDDSLDSDQISDESFDKLNNSDFEQNTDSLQAESLSTAGD